MSHARSEFDEMLAPEAYDAVFALGETPQFSARERPALAWTEALTRLDDGVSDEGDRCQIDCCRKSRVTGPGWQRPATR